MATRWLVGRMERPKGIPPAVELCFASASFQFKPRNYRCKPGASPGPSWKIFQPDGDPEELGWTRNPAWRYQKPEPAVEHGSAAGIRYRNGTHGARGSFCVAWRRIRWV